MRCTVLPGASHHPFGDPLLIGAGRESGPGRQVGQVTKEGHTTCFWLFFIPSSCESIAPFLPSRRSPLDIHTSCSLTHHQRVPAMASKAKQQNHQQGQQDDVAKRAYVKYLGDTRV